MTVECVTGLILPTNQLNTIPYIINKYKSQVVHKLYSDKPGFVGSRNHVNKFVQKRHSGGVPLFVRTCIPHKPFYTH